MQIPLVDGDLWWRYVARVEGWPETVGNIEDVKAVQTELMKVFQPNQPREKALAQAARPNSGCQLATGCRSTSVKTEFECRILTVIHVQRSLNLPNLTLLLWSCENYQNPQASRNLLSLELGTDMVKNRKQEWQSHFR